MADKSKKKKSQTGASDDMNTLIMEALMDHIPDRIYFKDLKSKIIRVNRACAKMAYKMRSPEEAVGKTDFDIFSKEHASQAYTDEQCIIKTGKPIVNIEEKETWRFEKKPRWISTTKMPFYDRGGNIIGTFGISRDITDRKKAEEKVEYLSLHDTLTGLYNRAYFEEELARLDTPRKLPLTIVMGDVNGLKVINDAYGHTKGDELLVKIAGVLKDAFRDEDILSRWGGDEFIAILPKTTYRDAQKIVRRIKSLCRKRRQEGITLSISLGIATKKEPERDIEDVIKKAENKMYKCKVADSKSVHESIVESLKENLKKGDTRNDTRIKKMEEYALLLGEKLNLSSTKLEELKLLINLHNIGKIALVDEIMSKKGRLTKEDWEIIKELPLIGYRIAESSQKLKTIAEPILAHHEWYNGSGYPRGIKGEEIPVISRISAIINAYEAMTSQRPYRKKMTKKEAIEEIKRCSGTQFDPLIAEVFIEVLKKEKEK
jgi:diguanylate cyclase (GGDEF)-like protein/PAS domain S-box-containing protein